MRVFVLTLALLVAVVEGEEPGCRVTRCVKRGASCRRVENGDLRVITGGVLGILACRMGRYLRLEWLRYALGDGK